MAGVSMFERLLPWACLAAAIVLFASQLLMMFEFTPPGAEPLEDRSVIDHHGPPLLILAVFAVVSLAFSVWAGSKPAAVAVAVVGALSLLIFLIIDLPDAGQVGTLDDGRQSFIDAEAIPQAGFWLEMIGALGLAFTGAALATMSPEQLGALRPGRGGEPAAEPAVRLTTPSERSKEPEQTEARRGSG